MKKILFIQTNFQPPGGANSVAVWMIEALKREHQVSLLSFEPIDLEAINRFYGTTLHFSQLKLTQVRPLIRSLFNLDRDPSSIQKWCYIMRLCKIHKNKYDLIISAENEMDFGCRGLQYIHFPYLAEVKTTWRVLHEVARRGKLHVLLKGRYRPWMLLSGFSLKGMKSNLTLTNSQWTKAIIKKCYDIEATVVYPPVIGQFSDVSWEDKENGFVCVGRFDPLKKIEQMIETLAEVRKSRPDIHFHIVGTASNRDLHASSDYYQKIMALVQENSAWVSIHQNLPRAELVDLLAQHRYGIHAHETEHFGMAVAEMVSAGCITFVPNDGGQVEIVDDERLIYADQAQAVEKILHVLQNPTEQAQLHAHMLTQKQKFTCEQFCDDIREAVRNF